jgi:CheY-like chemotaxis protein
MKEVLYIEDEERVARAMARALEPLLPAVKLRWVQTEREAVRVLASDEPLLAAIVDVHLGAGGDGLAAIEATRRWRSDLPVLVLTGLEEKEVERRAMAVRAMFVHKPVRPSEVEAVLRHYLEPDEELRLGPYRRAISGLADEVALTLLESEVLVWALDGRGRKDTAKRLRPERSEDAVKEARRRIVRKVGDAYRIASFEDIVELLRRRI